jgi:hypothetical protein
LVVNDYPLFPKLIFGDVEDLQRAKIKPFRITSRFAAQCYRLYKKVRREADFAITQLGLDARKSDVVFSSLKMLTSSIKRSQDRSERSQRQKVKGEELLWLVQLLGLLELMGAAVQLTKDKRMKRKEIKGRWNNERME